MKRVFLLFIGVLWMLEMQAAPQPAQSGEQLPYPENLYVKFNIGGAARPQVPNFGELKGKALAAKQKALQMRGNLASAAADVQKAAKDLADAQKAKKDLEKIIEDRTKVVKAKGAALKGIAEKAQQDAKNAQKEAAGLEAFQKVTQNSTDKQEAGRVAVDVKDMAKSVDVAVAQAEGMVKKSLDAGVESKPAEGKDSSKPAT